MSALDSLPWPVQLVLFLLFIGASAFGPIWLIVWCYERLFRSRTRAAVQAVARELGLHPIASGDKRVSLYRGSLLDFPLEVAGSAWLPVTDGVAHLEFARVPSLMVRVQLPRPFPVAFVIDAGRGVVANASSGDMHFDAAFRIHTADSGFVQTLLASQPLREAMAAIAGTGVRPVITHEAVHVCLSERTPDQAVDAARQAVRVARMLWTRAQFAVSEVR